eukprot:7384077-Prymnesium_polylepis.1
MPRVKETRPSLGERVSACACAAPRGAPTALAHRFCLLRWRGDLGVRAERPGVTPGACSGVSGSSAIRGERRDASA